MASRDRFKGKKVLVFGLGVLGGGVATTNWLLDQGALVTVTDLKDAKALASSIKRVEDHIKKTAKDGKEYEKRQKHLVWALGGHSKDLIDAADMIVTNPDVAIRNPYLQYAMVQKKPIYNEGTIFYELWPGKTVGITGTRGKTTTANWAHYLISGSILTGNSVIKPFQAALGEGRRGMIAVTELSSFILEHFDNARHAPHVAVITNLSQDHLNRHGTMEEYARAKANIFKHQKKTDWLILNNNNEWTSWFLEQQPHSQVRYTSLKALPLDLQGVWYADGAIWQREKTKEQKVIDLGDFEQQWGMHNVANLLAASLAAHLSGVSWKIIQSKIVSLPQVQYRQEVVYRDRTLTVVNDTTATSPEGGIAALRRWGGPNCILITGGTDRELNYEQWADELAKYIRPTNTIFLTGSATDKMRAALGRTRARGIRTYETLERCWKEACKRSGLFVSSVVLFSPAAKSFELFANEFDRGQQFNNLVKRDLEGGK